MSYDHDAGHNYLLCCPVTDAYVPGYTQTCKKRVACACVANDRCCVPRVVNAVHANERCYVPRVVNVVNAIDCYYVPCVVTGGYGSAVAADGGGQHRAGHCGGADARLPQFPHCARCAPPGRLPLPGWRRPGRHLLRAEEHPAAHAEPRARRDRRLRVAGYGSSAQHLRGNVLVLDHVNK